MRSLSFVLALGLLASPAAAQDFYGHVFAGTSQIGDLSFAGTITPPGGRQTVDTELQRGGAFGVALGTTINSLSGSAFTTRGELEFSTSRGDVDDLQFSGNGPGAENNVDGNISANRFFVNALVDFDTGTRFTPYAGLGLGVAAVDTSLSYGPVPGAVRIDDRDTVFSTQLILGAAYELTDQLSLTGDVRFIRDYGVSSERVSPAGVTGVVEDDIDTVNIGLGLRFKF